MPDKTRKKENSFQPERNEYLYRPRLNTLLSQVVKKSLTIVCAGMGCGKTRAVYDFSQDCGMIVAWVQLSESDNISFHFWENFVRAISQNDRLLSKEYKELGFPGTDDKMTRFFNIRSHEAAGTKYLLIFDDFHYIKNSAVLNFFERAINEAQENCSIVIISREFPQINISSLMVRDSVSIINEDELMFTEGELYHFLLQQGLVAETNSLSKIYKDTKGWAFIINFAVRMLKKTPGYAGYVQSAIKQDIHHLIEAENWTLISRQLRQFLLRLSLTEHRSAELVELLAQGDERLLSELKRQNAFVRYDKHIDFYYIHTLFLDFLITKQDMLTEDEIMKTYKTIAEWCVKNDFIGDALLNYEKIGDYESIMTILFSCSARFLMDNVQELLKIFNRMPESIFDSVEISAALHVQLVMNSGNLGETVDLLHRYEVKYMKLPENDAFRNRMLGCIYYQWAVFRLVMCTADDCYDFDKYYAKACACLERVAFKHSNSWYQHPPGLWTSLVGCNRAGSLQDFLDALVRSQLYTERFAHGLGEGIDDLCQGEMLYYQAHISKAGSFFARAMEKARKFGQFDIIWRVLFYSVRIAVFQGDYSKIELIFSEMEKQLENNESSVRYLVYDIIYGWYNNILGLPESIPYWLKEKYSYLVFYSNTLENYGNHIKAKYCYMTKNYTDLLEYIERKKGRDTILYERVELLAMQACVYYKMKDKESAFSVLQEAYEMASPNEIVIPFIELGKDMRVVLFAAANDDNCKIPQAWLKNLKQKASAYSKNQTQIVFEYKKINDVESKISLSPRETEILQNLCDGLSRSEIAAMYALSINTIKVHINSIYEKLNARNRADIFRIAIEQNLL